MKNPAISCHPPLHTGKTRRSILGVSVAALFASLMLGPGHAAAQTTYIWTAASGSWETPTNWTPNGVPGSADTAVFFNDATVTLSSAQAVNSIQFQPAGAVTIGAVGGNALLLTSGGTIGSYHSDDPEIVAAPVVIEGANGTYTFYSGNTILTNELTFSGGVTGGAAGNTVVTLTGLNTGANTISGIISNGSATTLGITVVASTGAAVNWVLSGMNTYTGPTQIGSGATLQAGSTQAFGIGSAVSVTAPGAMLDLNGFSNTIGSLTGVTGSFVNNSASTAATLTVGDSTPSTTFAGVLENTGGALSLIKQGSGTLILTAANSYTGATTVNAGTLIFTAAETFNGATTVNGGALVLNASNTFTGAITVNGGALILTAANTYAGVTTVNGGTLLVNNTTGSATGSGGVTVNGGTLSGNGTIAGSVNVNRGVAAPGVGSLGTLNIGGNYTQSPGGGLVIGIEGRQAGQFDVLAVGGEASLGGRLQFNQPSNFTLSLGQKITFLTAGQGVSGTFASVAYPSISNTILEPTVVYGSNSVALELVQGSFKTFAQNSRLAPNEVAVGDALDSAVSNPRASRLINYLNARSLGDLPGDFVKIDPEQLTSMFTVGLALANVQSMNIQRRADDIRSGSSGFSAAGFAMNGATPGYSGGFDITTGVAGPTGPDGKESKETKETAPADQRWGAFLSGTGEWLSVGDTDNARGYSLESGGFTLGVDYKVCEHFAVGLSFGYTGTTADLANGGRIFVNGGKVGIYSTTFVGGWYADAAVNGGLNDYDTHRSGLGGQASGSTDGGEFNGVFGTGYDFKKGALTFGPTATFNYTYVGLDDFSEHGSLAPLNIHGSDEESLRTALGFKVRYDWKIGSVVIKPELRVAWQHEFGDTTYALDSNFANGAGSSFLVNGPTIGRDSLLLSGGFAVQCSARCSAYVYYDGELGCANYHSSSVSGGFRIEF
jgi:autotransporter-associated beta strand protein